MKSHAILRAKERYGVELTPDEVEAMEQAIHHDQPIAIRLEDRRNGKPCHAVRHFPPKGRGKSRWFIAVTESDGSIATFVPRHHVSPDARRALEARHKVLVGLGIIPRGEKRKHGKLKKAMRAQGGQHAGRE